MQTITIERATSATDAPRRCGRRLRRRRALRRLRRGEAHVRAAGGLAVVRLETGDRQLGAIRLYERAGFRPCAAFGAYATMAPARIATSLFFEKRL